MKKDITPAAAVASGVEQAWREIGASFERFCLTAGIATLADGSKALAKAVRKTFGRHTPIQRCQVHKARNILERLPKPLHASVRKALRQAWELDDADQPERLIKNLPRRLAQQTPGVAASHLDAIARTLHLRR